MLRALKVRKSYGGTAALRGVTAEFPAGAVTVLEGANGSGKTTLLGVLGGIVRPSGGSVAFDGGNGGDLRGRVGWVGHEVMCYGDLSGRTNIELFARFYGCDPAEAWERCAGRFELGRFAERPLRTNSRGQRQRVALARALLSQPDIVLLDEPSTGLDTKGVERLLTVVEEERARGAVVVVVTHESGLFGEGRRIRLDRGRIVRDA